MPTSDDVIRDTPCGLLRGRRQEGVTAFLRVPYAAPPTGERRFAPPAPAWAGERDAARPGPIPPQLTSRLSRVMGDPPVPQDEDCLHLDIWVPDGADPSQPAPVLAFIHGGAFMTGGGSLPMYRGHELARRTGLVVVNISYRLGILGFLPIPGLAPANLGLQDQIAALRWIHSGIAGLGGDPGAVTLAGQSAGGYTIATLMACPATQGLFQRAVVMSAPLGLSLPTADDSAALCAALFRTLDLPSGDPGALRQLPVEALLQAQGRLAREWASTLANVSPPFVPVADGEWIRGEPLDALLDGTASPCPAIFGYTREEMAAFYAGDARLAEAADLIVQDRFGQRHGSRAEVELALARARRSPGDALAVLGDLGTRELFASPAIAAGRARQARGHDTYLYRFDWQSPLPGYGACHCIDLPFLFGNLDDWRESPMVNTADRAETTGLSHVFQDLIAAFARTGRPAGPALPPWPACDHDALLSFDRLLTLGQLPADPTAH
ncbi:MAG: carboxylesterase family protein [Pigmentiphaga sp.]|nr:carboxylesterase family protein [Pigmentiphaga sp.]